MSEAYDTMYDPMDRLDDRNYCKHGTFIGNPYGGDYMCGLCELGISDEEYAAGIAYQERRNTRARAARKVFDAWEEHKVLATKDATAMPMVLSTFVAMFKWLP